MTILRVYGFRLLLELLLGLFLPTRIDRAAGPAYPMPATTPPPEAARAA